MALTDRDKSRIREYLLQFAYSERIYIKTKRIAQELGCDTANVGSFIGQELKPYGIDGVKISAWGATNSITWRVELMTIQDVIDDERRQMEMS